MQNFNKKGQENNIKNKRKSKFHSIEDSNQKTEENMNMNISMSTNVNNSIKNNENFTADILPVGIISTMVKNQIKKVKN